jgi:sialic acid synthase SpsE
MHCVSIYPCPPEKLNLGTIKFFQKRYNLPVGFSSHSLEWQSSVAAVNLGAVVIEKHFTLDRNLWGSDHKVALLPNEFKAMSECLNRGDQMVVDNYGENEKKFYEEEAEFRPLFRKSLVAGQDLAAGTCLTKEMIYAMRPQAYTGGLPSEEYSEIVGKRIIKDLKKYESIARQTLE